MDGTEAILGHLFRRPCPFEPGSHVVAYARDSGGDEQDRSVDQQKQIYESYCKHHGLVLVNVYADRARPGGSTVGREDFELMIADLRNAESGQWVAGVIFWKLNRLARNVDDSQYYKADLRRRGYTLSFLADDIPVAGGFSAVIETVYEWKAQQDRIDMSIDVRRGLHSLVTTKDENGQYLGVMPGTPPRGFKRELVNLGTKRNGQARIVGRWVPDPELWDRCKQAWEMRAGGASLSEISAATRLYGSIHSYTTFYQNEIYRGVLVYGELRIENFVPACCTEAQWAAVQNFNKSRYATKNGVNTRRRNGRSQQVYLLTGVLRCAYCGSPMVGSRKRYPKDGYYHYYICQTKHRRPKECPSKRLQMEQVESAVLDYMFEHVVTPDGLRLLVEEWRRRDANNGDQTEQKMAELKQRLENTKRAIRKLLDLYEKDDLPVVSIRERLAEREQERVDVEAQLMQLQSQSRQQTLLHIDDNQLAEIANRWRDALYNGNRSEARGVLQGLFPCIDAEREGGKGYLSPPRVENGSIVSVPPRGLEPRFWP